MDWIKEIVQGLIETYGTRDLYEILDHLDITLLRKDLLPGKRGKFHRNQFGDEFITVLPYLEDHEEKLTIAHELGHAILHTEYNAVFYTSNDLFVKGKFEVQANKFAAELLIDAEKMDKQELEHMSIDQLSACFEVPRELAEYKFNLDSC